MTMGCFKLSWKKTMMKKKASMASTSLGKRWRDLSGRNHWKEILEPLDLELRQYILHYGEMAQATYDTFNSNTKSKYAGSTIYSRHDFFSKVGLEKGHPYCKYEVTKFLYATSQISMPESFLVFPVSPEGWTKESNWIGYVAVATDDGKQILGRRDIVVAWRGTIQTLEWINDFDFGLVDAKKLFGDNNSDGVRVHQGWYSIYTSEDERSPFNKASARTQVLEEIRRLVEKYKEEEISISICGHSLGAALSTLSATDIVANGYNRPQNHPHKSCPVTVFAFASPRVGDSQFKKFFSGFDDLRALRIRNLPDVVPIYPPIGYSEVGEELMIDTRKSPYLKSPGNPRLFHTMEVYLHGMAGTQGVKEEFKLQVERDIALVNKPIDGLKDEYMIPSSWRVLKNKGMTQQDDGSWILMDHETDDDDDNDDIEF